MIFTSPLSVLIEIPGYIFCLLTLNTCGRRPILSFWQLLSGVSCIVAGVMFPYVNDYPEVSYHYSSYTNVCIQMEISFGEFLFR